MDFLKFLSFLFPMASLFTLSFSDDESGGGDAGEGEGQGDLGSSDSSEGEGDGEGGHEGDGDDGEGSGDAQADVKDLLAKVNTLTASLQKSERLNEQLQSRVDQLFAQSKSQKESGRRDSWEQFSDSEIEELESRAEAAGDTRKAKFFSKMLNDRSVDRKIEKARQEERSNLTREMTWGKVTEKFPDLNNPDSEHYRRTVKYIQANPEFDNLSRMPAGHARAAEIVARDMEVERLQGIEKKVLAKENELKQKQSKESLGESSQKSEGSTGRDKLDELYEAAVKSGDPFSREWKAYLTAEENLRKGK